MGGHWTCFKSDPLEAKIKGVHKIMLLVCNGNLRELSEHVSMNVVKSRQSSFMCKAC